MPARAYVVVYADREEFFWSVEDIARSVLSTPGWSNKNVRNAFIKRIHECISNNEPVKNKRRGCFSVRIVEMPNLLNM